MIDNYIYTKWQKCNDYANKNHIYTDSRRCVRFYEGDQWHDERQPDYKNLPFYNFIKPIVDYKVAMVAKNTLAINYSPLNVDNQAAYRQMCEWLNDYASERWENYQMDAVVWNVCKAAAILGESYLYFGTADGRPQIIDAVNFYVGDEQEKDLQAQPFIIIRERRPVEDVRREAVREAKQMIAPDNPEDQINNNDNEVTDDKVTSFLYFTKNSAGNVTYARATKQCVYQPETEIPGMTVYPVAGFVWARRFNSFRGIGEVLPLIPNQIAVNRLLLRREVNNKQTGYARPVYSRDYINNPESIDRIGAKIEVEGGVSSVQDAFAYVQPAPMSSDGATLQNEIITTSRNLASVSDSATGDIDPQQASGKAISLVIDQNAIMTTEQSAMFRTFVEDIARIWLAQWRVYEVNGMEFALQSDTGMTPVNIGYDMLNSADIKVRVDVSASNPWSVYANDQEALNLLGNGLVGFEDYVELLSDQNHMKPKLRDIVKRQEVMSNVMQQVPDLGQGAVNGFGGQDYLDLPQPPM